MLKGHTYVRKMSPAVRAAVVQEYADGASCRTLAERYNLDHSSVWSFLKRHGQLRTYRESNRQLPVNEAAFSSITEASAYWAGFLMADGSVCVRQYSSYVSLSLSEKDGLHIEKFRDFLQSGHAIKTIAGKGFANSHPIQRFTVASRRLVEDLGRFGVIPNKTHTATASVLENDRHFWRGVVDGDGGLFYSTGKPILVLVGAKPLMTQFCAFVRSVVPSSKPSVRPMHAIWNVKVSAKSAVLLADALYDGCTIALDRKLTLARDFRATFDAKQAARVIRQTCTIAGCGKPVEAKGLCVAHYKRVRKNGSPHVVKDRWQNENFAP